MGMKLLVDAQRLQEFTPRAFAQAVVASEDAAIAAEALIAVDLRRVESQGGARLHHYLAHSQQGLVLPEMNLRIVRELPTALTIDAGNSLSIEKGFKKY